MHSGKHWFYQRSYSSSSAFIGNHYICRGILFNFPVTNPSKYIKHSLRSSPHCFSASNLSKPRYFQVLSPFICAVLCKKYFICFKTMPFVPTIIVKSLRAGASPNYNRTKFHYSTYLISHILEIWLLVCCAIRYLTTISPCSAYISHPSGMNHNTRHLT